MFAGHFGVAAAVKSKNPELPLWSLLVSSQLIDIAFVPFNLAGMESMEPIGEGGYANMIIYALYTLSLVGHCCYLFYQPFLPEYFGAKNPELL
ncbi:hypothetical protein SAMN04487943_103261 [Gracilibacillus orientalis]|uniref:Uncharacterized protein n=1 Tax=Gracilibacillus orientalis TaxID=334253 RepID=A0A1I4JYZ4_9BACI|nr:hypothetical protein SAMN04487943_103261 [Gracilibacillus orientalis]